MKVLVTGTAGRDGPAIHRHIMVGDADRTAAHLTLPRRGLGYAFRVPLEEGLRTELSWLESLLADQALEASSSAVSSSTGAQR